MAKGAYIGVGGVARKIKKGYVGVDTEVPIYGDPVSTSVTVSNIAEFFDVKNDNYYFKGSGGTFANTNGGVANSTAKTTLTAKVDMEVSFYYSYSSEAKYDKFSLVFGTTTLESEVSGAKTTKSYSGKLSVGESIVFTYTKDGSQDGNDDRCAFSTIVVKSASIIGTETKSLARKIKKAYIGIGGVARPCWAGGELAYYGRIDPFSQYAGELAATSNANYALFAGGYAMENDIIDTVNAYDKSLTRSSPTVLSVARKGLTAATVGNQSLFAGGLSGALTLTMRDVVDSYDSSLTRTIAPSLTFVGGYQGATTIGNYAIFAGGGDGYDSSGSRQYGVDAYDSSLTKTRLTDLTLDKAGLAATTVGNHALFGGGTDDDGREHAEVETFDSSLTKGTVTSLRTNKTGLAATTVGNHALFGGGAVDYNDRTGIEVDAYDSSLTRTSAANLSVDRSSLAATTVGDFALFGGGISDDESYEDTVDAYDSSLTRTTQTPLYTGRNRLAATTVGDFALFGGGKDTSGKYAYTAEVVAYTIA